MLFRSVLDPTFMTIEPLDFVLNAARFVPEVQVTDVVPSMRQDGSLNVEFDFRIRN